MSKHTLSFDDTAEGWTSFFSYIPEWMSRLTNKFFSMKDGQLYMHHDSEAPRNNFYGEQFKSKISFAFNESPSDIKVFKALGLEGNQPWEAVIKAFQSDSNNFSQSSLKDVDFVKKEGYWYAYVRRNEVEGDLTAKSNYGIGVVQEVSGNDIILVDGFETVTIGDTIFTEAEELVGIVDGYVGNTITLDRPAPEIENEFIFGVKDARIEGGEIRGYTSTVDMEVEATDKLELFAVNAEVFKSHR